MNHCRIPVGPSGWEEALEERRNAGEVGDETRRYHDRLTH